MSAPPSIEAELAKVWAGLAERKKIRACLFTLIIWAGDREPYFQDVAKRLLAAFPCRVMFLSEDRNNPHSLDISVTAAWSGEREGEVACDRIDIRVGEEARDRVPSLLLPHIVPDLPVYLVWGEDPSLRNRFFEALRRWADKLIFDSEISAGLPRFAQKLLALHSMEGQDIGDLNWVRTDPWRDLFCRTFQDPGHLQSLMGAHTVRIRYNACTGNFCHFTTAQAIYFQAWLASQLRWDRGSFNTIEHHQRVSCSSLEGEVICLILPEEREGVPEGQISGVEVECRDGSRYQFDRLDQPGFVADIQIEREDRCEMPMRVARSPFERGHSLAVAMVGVGTSPHFLAMLQWLARAPSAEIGLAAG